MSTIKDKMEKLMGLFKTFSEQTPETPQIPTNKVYQESELKISDKQVGGKVELIKEDGTLEPMPDGDYEIEGGDTFSVKDSFITLWNGEGESPAQQEPQNEDMSQDKQPSIDEAKKWLKDAIALHEKHMNGTAPTTGPEGEKSQMEMMNQMKNALASLQGFNGSMVTKKKDKEMKMAEDVSTDAPVTGTPEVEAQETNDVADLKAQVEAQAQAIDELKQAIADFQNVLSDNSTKEQAMSEQFNQKVEDLTNTLKTLAAMPAEFSKTNNSNIVKDSNDEKGKSFKEFFGLR